MDKFQSLPQTAAPVTVLIALPAALLRCGVKHVLLDTQPNWSVHEVLAFDAALAAADRCAPDVALIDSAIVPQEQISPLASLQDVTRIIVMGDAESRAEMLGWVAAGAHGYLARTADQAQLMCAIEAVMLDNVSVPSVPMAPAERSACRRETEAGDRILASLTERQRDVLELIMQGCSTKAIARDLDIAVGTVKVHLVAIYRLLGARSRLEAMVRARAAGAQPTQPARPKVAMPPLPHRREQVHQDRF